MRHFDHWLRAYCEYTRHSEPPLTFHFWTGVWTVAGALRRRVWRDEEYFQWTPNFYIVFVGPAGIVNKSTTINIGKRILEAVDGIYFGPDSGSWQGLGAALEGALQNFEYPPNSKEYTPMCAVSLAASELGTFLRPDDEQYISFLTDVWDGKKGTYIHKLKHVAGANIQNPWLNIIGATTPAWVQRNIKASMIGEGLLSRVIFVYGDKKRNLVALPSQRITTEDRAMRVKLIEDLQHIATLCGEFDYEAKVKVPSGWMDTWYLKHFNGARARSMTSDRYDAYLARKQTHMVKLAMVLSVAKRDDLIIYQTDLEEAEAILTESEGAMIRVFEAIGGTDQSRQVAEVLAFIRGYTWITAEELYRACWNTIPKSDFPVVVNICIQAGLAEWTIKDGKSGLSPKLRPTH